MQGRPLKETGLVEQMATRHLHYRDLAGGRPPRGVLRTVREGRGVVVEEKLGGEDGGVLFGDRGVLAVIMH